MLNLEKTYTLSIRRTVASGSWTSIRRTTLVSLLEHATSRLDDNGGINAGLTIRIGINLDLIYERFAEPSLKSPLNGRGVTISDDVRLTAFENETNCACNVETFLRAKFAEMELDMFHQMLDEAPEAQSGGAA